MDRVIESYVKDFQQEYDYPGNLGKSELFERFVNHCIFSRLHSERFEVDDVTVGGGGDMALDGVGIVVNDNLVFSREEVDELKSKSRRLEVKFIFIQSKTSSKFDAGEIGNFMFGVGSFFSNQPLPKAANEEIKALKELADYLYDNHSIDFDGNPSCSMYYVTTGSWQDDLNLLHRIQAEQKKLEDTNLFEKNLVEFFPIDSDHLKTIYKELKNKVDKQIEFERHTIIPQVDGVSEAYIGILPCNEYLKLICSQDGTLLKSLFYDNVRDFQGDNPVNREISKTLESPSIKDSFVFLNNGVTIVAKSVQKTGFTFTIRDFQIVNGCQTSHIIYENRNELDPSIYLPVKLIVTSNEEVTNRIIKATNRQTEVKVEAFLSLQPFQKELEEFYGSFSNDKDESCRLYYERRSKQYDSQFSNIKKNKIVSVTYQIKCFISSFLRSPHSTHRYYGELLKTNKDKIFIESHSFYPYYTSCLTCHLFQDLVKKGKIKSKYRKYAYHVSMVAIILVHGINPPPSREGKKTRDYCLKIVEDLQDSRKCLKLFEQSLEIIESVAKSKQYSSLDIREIIRRKQFSSDLVRFLESESQS